MIGTLSPRGMRLSVDLRHWAIPPTSGNPYSVPTVDTLAKIRASADYRYEGSTEIADGSSMLVSLGRDDHQVVGEWVTGERLVVITPKRILPEPKPGSDAKTADQATSESRRVVIRFPDAKSRPTSRQLGTPGRGPLLLLRMRRRHRRRRPSPADR